MPDPGFNPRYGWHAGVPRAEWGFGDPFGYSYGWQMAPDGFFPPPPGFAWFDIGGAASPMPPPVPWGLPGAMPAQMQQWTACSPWPHAFNMASTGDVNDGGFPGINFRNSYGGIGQEPGYNYIFPKDHCKIHVIISERAPWENVGPFKKRCFNVPCGVTVKELMQQFGCTNEDPAKNKLYEVNQGGDGRWYKGVTLSGDNKETMDKKIEDVGWNTKRNGTDEDFVWLYFTKD